MSDAGPVAGPPPLRRTLIVGSLWMVGLRWAVKLFGLVNTMILARLLVPEDFGLTAMAMAVVAIVSVLFEFGVDYALIQKADATRDHFNAAWTIRLIQASLAALLVVACAPLAAAFYGEPRVVGIMFVLGGATLLRGFANIGVVAFRKELEFHKEFRFLFSAKLISVVGTVALALALRSYWALVIGIALSYLVEVVLSYVMHPFRPKLSLGQGPEIWSFSKWMVVVWVSTHVAWRLDRIVLGALAPPQAVGFYAIGTEIAELPGAEVIAPISRSLVPGFAKLKSDRKRLNAAYLKSVGAAALIGLPSSLGLAAVAPLLVPLALGGQWHEAVPIVQILAVYAAVKTLYSASANLLLVTGAVRSVAVIAFGNAVAMLALFYPAFSIGDVAGLASAKVCIAGAGLMLVLATVLRTRGIDMRSLGSVLWRPMVATATMVGVVLFAASKLADATPAVALIAEVALGALVYCLAVLAMWIASGRPTGVESDLLKMAWDRIPRRLRG